MTGIDDDRKMGQALDHGDSIEVKRVSGVRLKRSDPAFTEDHILIATGENVLCRHEKLFNSGRDASLEENRFWHFSDRLKQGEVAHVPGPDLDHICSFSNEFESGDVLDLGDDFQPGGLPGLTQELKPFLAANPGMHRAKSAVRTPHREELRAADFTASAVLSS